MIDIGNALRFPDIQYEFEESIPIEEVALAQEYTFSAPIKVYGTMVGMGASVVLNGTIQAQAISQCVLCLEETVKVDISVPFKESFSAQGSMEEGEYGFSEGAQLDIAPMVIDALVPLIPMRFVCKDDCCGLCPVCGVNLNKSQCDCTQEESSPFSALRALFEEKEVDPHGST